MQLKSKLQKNRPQKNIRDSLAVATCTLLAGVAPQTQAQDFQSPWQIDSGLLFYSEKDRVQAIEPVVQVRKEIDDNEFVTTRIVADSLTGASPNGAVPSDSPQTFTSPSGNKSYTTPANEIPLDSTFKDFRAAVNVDWEKPLTERLRGIFGASFSSEHDYTSMGVSASFAQDFNQRNTTLTAALAFNADTIGGEGRSIPTGLTVMPAPSSGGGGEDDEGEGGDTKGKNTQEYLIGVTQVLGRNTLTQLNYSYTQSNGYLTDPYKILSVLENDGSGNLRATSASVPTPYVFEKRPDNRNLQTIYWKGLHQLPNEDVITLAYRYGWDDWGITSNTLDVRYRFEMGNGHYLQPHWRHYTQTAADFYRQTLTDGEELTLDYASADPRLGELTSQTIGLKYGIVFDQDAEINFRFERFTQTGKTRSQDAVGKLSNVDLYPDNEASIIQVGISGTTDGLFKRLGRLFGGSEE